VRRPETPRQRWSPTFARTTVASYPAGLRVADQREATSAVRRYARVWRQARDVLDGESLYPYFDRKGSRLALCEHFGDRPRVTSGEGKTSPSASETTPVSGAILPDPQRRLGSNLEHALLRLRFGAAHCQSAIATVLLRLS